MSPSPLTALHVVAIRYGGTTLAVGDARAIDAYAAAKVYDHAGVAVDIVEPRFPEDQRVAFEPDNLGVMGGEIAAAVAAGRRQDKAIVVTGGDCSHNPGILGGLQDIHGPTARIGLVWFDAHGDFNTPKTTLTGRLGGMPVAVSTGLAYPRWRERSHLLAPLPTDRIVMVDVRNLDPSEEQLIRATEVVIASPAAGFPGKDLNQAVNDLAARCDMLYLHIDSDILDESYVPNHSTREPNGPNMEQVLEAIDTVMATGKVVTFALVAVYGAGAGSEVSVASAIQLLHGGLESWRRYGMAE